VTSMSSMAMTDRPTSSYRIGEIVLRILVAAGLAIDAYVHADVAHVYAVGFGTGWFTGQTLFLIEAGVASFAALMVLVTGARIAYAFAFLVAASAFGAVMLYRYVNVGKLGPIPNLYENTWFTEKTVSAIAEAVALVCAAIGVVLPRGGRRLR
jgi:hypothetical protein